MPIQLIMMMVMIRSSLFFSFFVSFLDSFCCVVIFLSNDFHESFFYCRLLTFRIFILSFFLFKALTLEDLQLPPHFSFPLLLLPLLLLPFLFGPLLFMIYPFHPRCLYQGV
ncbi:hypothetical protein CSUI_003502 [Cystoisospora suis]|uniref:Transmembrane protein n=1 Tax=Cystoisospora suis TaxID=483139 RepID=A0A2C6L428_9APIC|nr:hypothetical protein CSUI_003502 [Cystoisospora suis]